MWQPLKISTPLPYFSSLKNSGSNSDSDVEQATTTTTSTPGVRALKDKYNNNTEGRAL